MELVAKFEGIKLLLISETEVHRRLIEGAGSHRAQADRINQIAAGSGSCASSPAPMNNQRGR